MEALQLEDFTGYRFLSAVQLSPNGSYAAYGVKISNPEKQGYLSDLWITSVRDGQTRQYTGMGDVGSFRWLDDDTLFIQADREHLDKEPHPLEPQTHFYTLRLDGGEALKAFTLPLRVTEILPLNDSRWAVRASYDNANPTITGQTEEDKAKARKAYDEEQDYTVLDEIPFWQNGAGITNKKRNRIYLYDAANGSLTPVSAPSFDVSLMKVNDTRTQLMYIGVDYSDKMELTDSLWTLDLGTAQARERIPAGTYQFRSAEFLGQDIVFAASEHRKYTINENPTFSRLDPEGRIVRFADPDFSVGNTVGSDCRLGEGRWFKAEKDGIYCLVTDRACSRLCKITYDGHTEFLSQAEGSMDVFAKSGGTVVFIGMREQRLQELYQLELSSGEEIQLTNFNDQVLHGKYVAVPQPLSFVNKDSVEIDGWVLLPKDYDASRTYPAILNIHGGPKTVYGTVFFHEMQLWANDGYFVLYSNPRGGDGRGDDFADIRGRYGTIDYEDLMEFTDRALAAYPAIDSQRLGVTGGSYGGFMTNWIIGHTERFAAAVSQRSISNWISMCCTTDIGYYFAVDQTASTPWDGAEHMWEQSPLKYADRVQTPTLFLHSDEDFRCWQVEALQMFTALKMHGVASRLCLFKGENHELSRSGKPVHRIRRLKEISAWFHLYLQPTM
ncbi:peptidase S9 [Paenibacillus sp. J53TS2]|uniref:alpha/beta hydrolase family protein n=1 Tax=Paenibacillus sp. J53TS2 TaxID=2807197 RepID=UPI001B1C1F06|nr:S9 family peptidase [Paenibacillus sp. J53TS2]GIP46768.1 peptidase S9 [Paenibacillus sp. J53TS2]